MLTFHTDSDDGDRQIQNQQHKQNNEVGMPVQQLYMDSHDGIDDQNQQRQNETSHGEEKKQQQQKDDLSWFYYLCYDLPLEVNLCIQLSYLMNLHILELIGQLHKDNNWDDLIRIIFTLSDVHVIEKIDLKLVCQLTSIFGEVSIDSHSPAFEIFVSFLECYQVHPNLIKFHVNTGISRRRSTFPFYHLNYSKALRSLVGLAKQADFVELDHEDIDDIHKYGLICQLG
ncbi:unnamed protein product [Ambrosiozyma monospora]|uniref:Unnamed protein product n=1 Tax=Ambrosiozyma monospora TaxID=43982 RepID=A0ACB5U6Q2_AMBMO|nr:unnamed protein product [Ambrosiozyma monospora]